MIVGRQPREGEPSQELDGLAHAVIGAALEVHRVLGPGYLESIYEKALHAELEMRRIPFIPQPVITVEYRGRVVGEGRLDLLVAD